MAENKIKQLLSDMKKREDKRVDEVESINAEIERLDSRKKSEAERFMVGIEEDRKAGIYNHITDGKFQKLIDEQKTQIEEKYNGQIEELKQKLEEINKKHIEEKSNDYKQINAEIKAHHVEMVLESNKAQKELEQIKLEQDKKIQEIDNKIKQKEAEQTHLIMQNRKFMDIGTNGNEALTEIDALGIEIENLKTEKDNIANEYLNKIEEQNKIIQHYLELKERASGFLSKIRLSEKSIDEISDILFGEEVQEKLPVEEVPAQDEPKVEEAKHEEPVEEVPAQDEPKVEEAKHEEPVEEELATEGASEQKVTVQELPVEGKKVLETQRHTENNPIERLVSKENADTKGITDENARGFSFRKSDLENFENVSIYVDKDGSAMNIETTEGLIEGRYTPLVTAKGSNLLEKIDFELIEKAEKIGDKYVVREILGNTQLGTDKKEELLKAYSEMIQLKRNNSKADISMYREKLDLHYDLRGIEKSYLTKEEKDTLLAKAREAKKLKIADVKPGVKVSLQWLWQDAKDIAKGLMFWNKNKAITAGERSVVETSEETEPKNAHRAFSEELGNTTYDRNDSELLPGMFEDLEGFVLDEQEIEDEKTFFTDFKFGENYDSAFTDFKFGENYDSAKSTEEKGKEEPEEDYTI